MPRIRRSTPPSEEPEATEEVDLNQVVAHNVRAARDLRGWTQEELADRLEPFIGQRLTQAGVSSIERAWDSDRRREFDAQELLVFARVFDLPLIWFLLPPPGDDRRLQATHQRLTSLYSTLLGQPHQLEPLYQRLRELGKADPTAAEEEAEIITGIPSDAKQWSYRERRKEILLALLDEHADGFDRAMDKVFEVVQHIQKVGIRGFVAEHTHDEDFSYRPEHRSDDAASTATDHTDEAAPAGSERQEEVPGGTR